jgi:signal transduction histidine kinase
MGIIDLSRLLDEVAQEVLGWGKQTAVQCKVEPSLNTWGNADLLKQLMLILSENALRYTPEGGTVSLSSYRKEERCIVRVSDTGIGIDPQDLPHIFERFYRAERARVQCPDGSGLGLAIGKWIVEQHGGSIIVTSIPGQGTDFIVSLPKISD